MIVAIRILSSVEPPGQRDDDDRDDQEQHHAARRGQAVEAGLVLLVDHRRDDVGGETRSALGHRPDQVERAQAPDEGQRDDRGGGWPGEWQHDVPEDLPAAGSVDLGCFVVLRGNRDEAGDEDDRGQSDALPYVDQGDGEERKVGVGQPTRVSTPTTPAALLIRPFSGSIKTVKVSPTPIVLTSTGKKTTERR